MCSRSFFNSGNRLFTGLVALLYNIAVADEKYLYHSNCLLLFARKCPVLACFQGICIFLQKSVTGQIIAYFCKLLRPNSSKIRSKTKIPTTKDFKVQSSSMLPIHSHMKCHWHMRTSSDTFATYP